MRLENLLKQSAPKKTIAVAMAHIDQVICCMADTLNSNAADYILIGDTGKIRSLADEHHVDLSATEIIRETDETRACALAASLIQQRRADIPMKGLAQTSTFLRALLDKKHGLRPENGLVSQVSVFDIPVYHKLLIITDPGINIAPDLAQKVSIVKNAVAFAHSLGIAKPKVACIGPTEKVSDKIPSTTDAHKLSSMKEVFDGAFVEGPYALDIAVSREAAATKGIDGVVAGDADILLLPDINSGNVIYKSLTLFGRATVAGLIAGLRVPVILTSRSDSDNAKKYSILLALSISG